MLTRVFQSLKTKRFQAVIGRIRVPARRLRDSLIEEYAQRGLKGVFEHILDGSPIVEVNYASEHRRCPCRTRADMHAGHSARDICSTRRFDPS